MAEGGVSLLVATCDAGGAPDCVRAVGLRVWPGASQLTVLLPAAMAETSVANVRANPRLAMTFSQIASHRTVQLKGAVLAVRDGDEADRLLATQYRVKLAESLAFVGSPAANTMRMRIWPCVAIDLDIEVVYAQTPGPVAGVKMPLASGRL